jgi:polyhydroxybutyrate depolymerase
MKSLLPLIVFACACLPATAQEQRLVHHDVKRKFIVYTPASYASNPQQQFPVVINYHGGGMTMREQMLYTRMNQTAERENFIVVYPQGIKQDWNVNLARDSKESSDDIGFTEAMLAKLKADYRIDQRRVYATGLSRGGFFSLRVAAELPHLVAAVAVVGAATPQSLIEQQVKPGKVGVMHISGTADTIVAFDGKPGNYLSAGESHRYWLKTSGVDGAPASERTIDSDKRDDTVVTHAEQSRDGVSMALVTVRNGGHTWPGADPFNVGLPLGATSRDIDANTVIWEFLGKHRK